MAKITYDQLLTLYKKKGIANDTKAKTALYKDLTQNKGIQVDMPTPTKAPIGIMERASMVGQQRGDQGKQAAASFGQDTGANFMKGATQAISGLGQIGQGIQNAVPQLNVSPTGQAAFSSKDIGLAAQKLFSGGINTVSGATGAAFAPVTAGIARTPLQGPLESFGKGYMDIAGKAVSSLGVDPSSEFGQSVVEAPMVGADLLGLKGIGKAGKAMPGIASKGVNMAEKAFPKVAQSVGEIAGGFKQGTDVISKYLQEQAKNIPITPPKQAAQPLKIIPEQAYKEAESLGIATPDVDTVVKNPHLVDDFKRIFDIKESTFGQRSPDVSPALVVGEKVTDGLGFALDKMGEIGKKLGTQGKKMESSAITHEDTFKQIMRIMRENKVFASKKNGKLDFSKSGALREDSAARGVLQDMFKRFVDIESPTVVKPPKYSYTQSLLPTPSDLAKNRGKLKPKTLPAKESILEKQAVYEILKKHDSGLGDTGTGIMKQLKKSIMDDVIRTTGKEYAELATEYYELRSDINDVLGLGKKSIDVKNPANSKKYLGEKSFSSLLGSATARVETPLQNIFGTLEKYGYQGAKFADIKELVRFADMAEELFGSGQTRSLPAMLNKGQATTGALVKGGKNAILENLPLGVGAIIKDFAAFRLPKQRIDFLKRLLGITGEKTPQQGLPAIPKTE